MRLVRLMYEQLKAVYKPLEQITSKFKENIKQKAC